MAKIGSLYVDLALKTLSFSQGFKRANGIVAKFKKTTVRAMKAVVKSMFSFKSAIGVVVGSAGIGLLVKKSLDAVDNIGKMSRLYQIATEDIGAMSLAARLGGTDLNTMLKASRNVSRQMFDFSRGVGEAKDAMDVMGITVDDINPLMDDQLKLMAFLAENVNNVTDSVDRLAIAQDIFGGRATVVLNALDGGIVGMEAFRKEAELLGGALSADAVKGVEDANDSITRLSFLFSGLTDQMVSALAPALKDVVDYFREWIVEVSNSEGGIKQFAQNAAVAVLDGAKSMVFGLQGVMDFVDQLERKMESFGLIEVSAQKETVRSLREGLEMVSARVQLAKLHGESEEFINAIYADRDSMKRRLLTLGVDELSLIDRTIAGLDIIIEKIKTRREVESQPPTKGGGTGGAKIEGQEEALANVRRSLSDSVAAIEQSLMSEEERILKSYERRSLIVEEAFLRDQISDDKKNTLLEQLSAEHEAKKTAILKKGEDDRRRVQSMGLGAAANIFNGLSALMDKSGKEMSSKQKIFARAGIIASTAQAVMNALAVPPYPLGLALAARAALQGANQLRKVGGGGGAVSPPVASPAAQLEQSQPIPTNGAVGNNEQGLSINVTVNGFVPEDNIGEAVARGVKDAIDSEALFLTVNGQRAEAA